MAQVISSLEEDLRPIEIDLDQWSEAIDHPAPFACGLTVGRQHAGEIIAHVSNVEYVNWLDRSAQLHSDSLGYTREYLLGTDMMWFVARHEIDYLQEVWPGDQLVVFTWINDMQRIKSWREYIIVRASDRAVVCKARTLWVLVNLKTRRPKRIPAEMIDQFLPTGRPSHMRT